jgi:hypothetical protein
MKEVKHVHVMIAHFGLDDYMMNDPVYLKAKARLEDAGVLTTSYAVTGHGEVVLDLDGAMYYGDREINWGIDLYLERIGKMNISTDIDIEIDIDMSDG